MLEIGYRLRRKFWGQGLATEVSRALLKKAFEELGAGCVFGQTLAGNRPSRRVMEKIGMGFEREFIDQHYLRQGPAVLYRVSREKWENRFAKG